MYIAWNSQILIIDSSQVRKKRQCPTNNMNNSTKDNDKSNYTTGRLRHDHIQDLTIRDNFRTSTNDFFYNTGQFRTSINATLNEHSKNANSNVYYIQKEEIGQEGDKRLRHAHS